jgi:competence protein ComEC
VLGKTRTSWDRVSPFTAAGALLWAALLLTATSLTLVMVATLLTGLGGLLALVLRRGKAAVVALVVVVGLAGMAMRMFSVATDPAQRWLGQSVSAQATISADPRPTRSGTGWAVPARLDRIGPSSAAATDGMVDSRLPVLVLADDSWADVALGSQVHVIGALAASDRTGSVAAVLTARGEPEQARPPPGYQRLAAQLRAGLQDATDHLTGPARELIPSLVVGDTRRLSPLLVADLRDSGLAHLTAVSGANVSIVLLGLLLLARVLRIRPGPATALGVLGIVGFLLLARPEPSVLRASVMGLLGLAAITRSGRTGGINVLGAAVCLLLLADPWLSRSLGFALSVVATAALMVPARWIAGGSRRAVVVAFAAAAAAQAAVLPLLLLIQPQVSLVAVAANLVAAPAVAPATLLGVLATIVAPVSAPLAAMVANLAGVAGNWIGWVARTAAGLDAAVIALPGGRSTLFAALALTLAGLWLTRRAARPLRWWGLGVGLALIVAMVGRDRPPSDWLMAMCDVGQGDAVVVATGPGSALVVDTGPDPVALDRCLDALNVTDVPLLVLTHFHDDHVRGLSGLLGSRPVAAAVVSPLADPGDAARKVQEELLRRSVPTQAAVVGRRWQLGEVTAQVLWPQRLIREGSMPNQASVVLRVQTPRFSALLTGDIEAEAQRALLAAGAALDVDVLKVPHHGSADQDPGLLMASTPEVALIGVGADNSYGHPDAGLIQELVTTGATVGRTDLHGTLIVTEAARRLTLHASRPG